MRLSVIIPAYNDLVGVLVALNSLRAFAHTSVEYLVQDDASPLLDFTPLIPPCAANTARNPSNLGFAGNCHAGVTRAMGDVVCMVNQDAYGVAGWSDGWDMALLSAFDDPAVGIVAPRLLFPDGSVQSAGGMFDALAQPIHRCLGWTNPHHPDAGTPGAVAWATGAVLAIRRSVWDALGGFDTAYGRGYFEDVDVCLKAREAGYTTWYEPRATLVHRVGSTGGSPTFADNARLFKRRWVDTGKVKPGMATPTVRYW